MTNTAPISVALDITSIQYGRGVSRYTSNLVSALEKFPKEVQLQLFASGRNKKAIMRSCEEFASPCTNIPIPVSVLSEIWNRFHSVPLGWFISKPDVVHTWDIQPPDKELLFAHTIHDLAMWKFPQTANPTVFRMLSQSYKILLNRKSRFIAVSNTSKADFVEQFQVDPDRIDVVYEALPRESAELVSALQLREVKEKYQLLKPYLLFIGTSEPRKNLKRMIEAWLPYSKEFEFVLVGERGWDSLPKHDGLRSLGYLEKLDLSALIKGSSGLMYASLYEGFGLPILEGFFHGVPVLTSHNSGMKEVAGSAAVFVNPIDVGEISAGIEKVMKQRSQLVKKGRERLKHYSWEKTAKETIDVYRKLIQEYSQ